MKLSVLGAGAWGTALAASWAPHHEVTLWGRNTAELDAMRASRVNARYLPGCPLPDALHFNPDFDSVADEAELIVIAVPPTATTLASRDSALAQHLAETLSGHRLRIYAHDDVIGVEIGGALKNVMAIAAGICDGLQLGHNARAALITRGLAEMTRLGVELGGRFETFMGLSGLGDLILTTTGDLSRNRQVGLRLARGQTLETIPGEPGHGAAGATHR